MDNFELCLPGEKCDKCGRNGVAAYNDDVLCQECLEEIMPSLLDKEIIWADTP